MTPSMERRATMRSELCRSWIAPDATTLLWDLDGTLVKLRSRARLEASMMVRGARRFSAAFPVHRFYGCFWNAARTAQNHFSDRTNHEVLTQTLAAGARCSEVDVRRMLDGFVSEDFATLGGRHFGPIPGAREALQFARDLGYRLVLATNPVWPQRAVRMRLEWGGLTDVPFEFVSHSEVMTRCKPSLAYYRELLERVGLRAEDCIMIGNDPIKDLPATELGIRTFLLRAEGPGRKSRTADRRLDVCGTFDELRHWLDASKQAKTKLVREGRLSPMTTQPAPRTTTPTTTASSSGRDGAPRIICVTGPDGSGKTTQVTKLAEVLERTAKRKVAAVTIWDLLLDPTCKGKVLFDDPAKVDRYLSILHPTSRALFLYHCYAEALELAKKRGADVLLLNSYWYKYYATEVAHGGDRDLLRQLAVVFPEPDLTFYLRVHPEEAFARKARLSGYETGFAEPRSKEGFVSFQRVAHGVLEDLSKELGWVVLDGKEPIHDLTDVMSAQIARTATKEV